LILIDLLFYTKDGTDLNSWSKGEKSPVFTAENSSETKTDDEKSNIASDEVLGSWALKDYLRKNNVGGTDITIKHSSDGNREITIYDSTGKALEKYTVDPKTGKGVNSANEAVDLPQTGDNSLTHIIIMTIAMAMLGLGILCLKSNLKIRRKEE